MRTGVNHLFIPGRTNIPGAVRKAMNVPMQDRRTHDFRTLTLFVNLKIVFKTEGLEGMFARLADGIRAAVRARGLTTAAGHAAFASNTVTAIREPADVDARDVIRIGHDRDNCAFGSGLGPLAGRVFRIRQLGDINEGMCLTAIALAELSPHAAGARVAFGTGVAAAQAVHAETPLATARLAAE
jgi:alanine-glyoxylate transaminase/serine-glyoxylate transaminase/serine-pyruvate transaminase